MARCSLWLVMGSMCAAAGCQGLLDEGFSTDTAPYVPPSAPTCNDDVDNTPRRLSHWEYQNTLRSVFGAALGNSPPTVVHDSAPRIFENDVQALEPTELLIEQYYNNSRTIADAVVPTLTACTTQSCRRSLIETYGLRLFRRPLTSAEIGEFDAVFSLNADFTTGATLWLQSMLMSPMFLYHDQTVTTGQRITQYATAERISYFLWGEPPDVELLTKAQQNQLSTRAQIEAEVNRMLEDPRAFTSTASGHGRERDYSCDLAHSRYAVSCCRAFGMDTQHFGVPSAETQDGRTFNMSGPLSDVLSGYHGGDANLRIWNEPT